MDKTHTSVNSWHNQMKVTINDTIKDIFKKSSADTIKFDEIDDQIRFLKRIALKTESLD